MYKWKKLMKTGAMVSSDSSCTSSNSSTSTNSICTNTPETPPASPPNCPSLVENKPIHVSSMTKMDITLSNTSSASTSKRRISIDETSDEVQQKIEEDASSLHSPGHIGKVSKRKIIVRAVSENLENSHQGQRDQLYQSSKRRKPSKSLHRFKLNHISDHQMKLNLQLNKIAPQKRLLATPEDPIHLNALHCFVRENIQVFTATTKDINVPAPGRKSRVYIGQVGLRCIHCQNVSFKNRVKRAVCYPSSVSRVYHSVSDMKFDHFTACKSIPPEVKARFLELKNAFKRRSVTTNSNASDVSNNLNINNDTSRNSPVKKWNSSLSPSSTAQFYLDSAKSLGMVDFLGGVFMKSNISRCVESSSDTVGISRSLSTSSSLSSTPSEERMFVNPANEKQQNVRKFRNASLKDPVVRFLWNDQSSLPFTPKCLTQNRFQHFQPHHPQAHPSQHLNSSPTKTRDELSRRPRMNEQSSYSQTCPNTGTQRHSYDPTQKRFPRPDLYYSHGLPRTKPYQNVHTQEPGRTQAEHGTSCERKSPSFVSHTNYNSKNEGTTVHKTSSQPSHVSNFHHSQSSTHFSQKSSYESDNTTKKSSTVCLLALQDDKQYLNALHCFVRRNVEIFTATEEDIAAPSPGRKQKVVIGQVGLRCIHCSHFSLKDRVKRAVCYPPTVSGIYHCVSNMKFDHFGACRGMPPKAKEEFLALKKSCTRRSGNNSGGSGSSYGGAGSIFTAHYYQTSAVNIGLVDTKSGIRFKKQTQEQNETLSKQPLSPSGSNQRLISTRKSPLHSSIASGDKAFQSNKEKAQCNDGLSALVIAATEHSVCKDHYLNTKPMVPPQFSPLQNPNILPSGSFPSHHIHTNIQRYHGHSFPQMNRVDSSGSADRCTAGITHFCNKPVA